MVTGVVWAVKGLAMASFAGAAIDNALRALVQFMSGAGHDVDAHRRAMVVACSLRMLLTDDDLLSRRSGCSVNVRALPILSSLMPLLIMQAAAITSTNLRFLADHARSDVAVV